MFYKLDDENQPVETTIEEIVTLYGNDFTWRRVGNNTVTAMGNGTYWISTVFLTIDHNFTEGGLPILWETMVFNHDYGNDSGHDLHMKRYVSHEEALRGHLLAVKMYSPKDRVFEIETHAPKGHAACLIRRTISHKQGREAARVLLRESFPFGIKAVWEIIK